MTFVTIITVIAVFSLLIVSHEFGHFIVAKASGVFVEDFSLGMGPKLLQFKGKETTYTLRPFPIGGWCKMRGEDEDVEDPRGFRNKKIWQQMLVIFAGPLMNFILAFIIFIVVFMMLGTPSTANVVGEPLADTPAAIAGVENGDVIQEINGAKINQWQDISQAINLSEAGQTVNMTVERDGELLQLAIEPYFNETAGAWMVGIAPVIEHQNFFTAIKLGFVQSVEFTVMLVQGIYQMITGEIAADIAGPVGIASLVGQATESGLQSLLILTGFLSINLGLINLFPLPALDGSRLAFLFIELLRGKPISRAKEGMVHFVGLMLLFGVLIFITYKDIIRLVTG